MFFEGSEKKAEVIVDLGEKSLRSIDESFWSQLVSKCEATILSKISNESCDAYLLSESSLFVFDDRFTILTCGQTVLINSILFFIEGHDRDCISQIIFQVASKMLHESLHNPILSFQILPLLFLWITKKY